MNLDQIIQVSALGLFVAVFIFTMIFNKKDKKDTEKVIDYILDCFRKQINNQNKNSLNYACRTDKYGHKTFISDLRNEKFYWYMIKYSNKLQEYKSSKSERFSS